MAELWPTNGQPRMSPTQPPPKNIARLKKQANALVNWVPAPVETIRSAGVSDQNDTRLIQSRRAFQDSDVAVLLALAFVLIDDARYLNAVDRILNAWAGMNKPTGHPIDESRLDGLIWAYDLVACKLSGDRAKVFKQWLEQLRETKERWQFGPLTRHNNHRTHQLKIQILLDKVLGDDASLQRRRSEVRDHLKVNLGSRSDGASLDYEERDALYYHVFNLEAWCEIQLQLQCCETEIRAAFEFFAKKVQEGDTGGEFAQSIAPIDAARAAAGFDYAQRNERYDVGRAARLIVQFYTFDRSAPVASMWSIAQPKQGSKSHVFYFVRREIWNRSL